MRCRVCKARINLQSDVSQKKKLVEASAPAVFEAVSHMGLEINWGNSEVIKVLQVVLSCFEEESVKWVARKYLHHLAGEFSCRNSFLVWVARFLF